MSSIRNWLLTVSTPIQKLMQRLHPPEPQTTFEDAEQVLSLMLPGDVLLSREKWHFTNLFIPGYWSHAALFGGENEVVEAVAPRVRRQHFFDWVLRKHSWCVLRVKESYNGQLAFDYAWSTIKAAYDYNFSLQNDRLYCSEMVWLALNKPFAVDGPCVPQDFYQAMIRGELELIHERRDP